MEYGFPLLSSLIFLPVIGAIGLLFIPRKEELEVKRFALLIAILEFFLSLPLWFGFDKTTSLMQFVEKKEWISSWNVYYYLGVDGISVLFVLLSTLITILCILVSWTAITEKIKEFFAALLFLEGVMIGVFCALDFFLFYIFWEAMLIPMYLIIGVWGGPGRLYATIKFFLYTLIGSLLMLVGIIMLYLKGGHTFDILKLASNSYDFKFQMILFWTFFAAFAVKVPMWPVHTWLPDAHTEAPAAGSVILAGILIKMGAYGFLRFSMPICPQATQAMTVPMLVLSVIAIIYGAVICLGQDDMKRLIAYSSVSHMGFVTLGIFALNYHGLEGAILQMINHGVVTGALFLSVGIIYEQTHTREISDYGGLATVTPIFAGFFLVFTLASIGFPSLNGFVGEFLILLGGFTAKTWAGFLGATGIIIGAGYMLWLYQRVFFMKVNEKVAGVRDINLREIITLLPMLILIFWIGIFPNTFLSYMHVSVTHLLDQVNQNASLAQTGPQAFLETAIRLIGG